MTSYDGGNLTAFKAPGNGLIVVSGPNPDNETYTVAMKPGAGTWRQFGLELVQDESLPGIRLARGADRLVITELDADLDGRKLPFIAGVSNLSNQAAEYLPVGAFDGDPKTGWAASAYNETPKVMLALRFAEPVTIREGQTLTVRIHHDSEFRRSTLGRFRLALSKAADSGPNPDKGKEIPDGVLRAIKAPESSRTAAQKSAVAAYYQWASTEAQAEAREVSELEMRQAMLEIEIPHSLVSESVPPAETRILSRGNWMDETGAIVEPAIPAFLGKLETGGKRATRMDLANWLVSKDNPLTARVYVNRVWREFFGTGFSKVLDDLGSQGEWPTHPELLDWLASEFMEHWDMKHLVRTIVMSKTYRQSSMSTPEMETADPDNRLLARQSRFRVDAEVVRDIALYVSGLMQEKFGGPSAKPYQPDGYLATLNFPKREYSASHGADLYRRGVYTFWQRSFLHPSLLTFDAPTREECVVNRVNSNTPLQALVLLNDPTYVEAARVFAERMVKRGIGWGFETAVSRKASAEELKILDGLYKKELAHFKGAAAEAADLIHVGEAPVPDGLKVAELAAMTTVARAILNTHETITRN
jgi:hypothetical protein